MQEKGVMLQDHSMKGQNKSGAKALMNTIMQLRFYFNQLSFISKVDTFVWG